jgi:peptidoglycan/LPS O-acetylase OafA/YrhL
MRIPRGAPAAPMPSGEIRALTSLRGVAAMMVVLTHYSAAMEAHSARPIPSLVPHGYIAVDLFFILSGFIMAYTYLADFRANGIRAFPSFLLKRIARIVPLNTASVLFVLALGGLSTLALSRNIVYESRDPVFDVACNLLMTQGLGLGTNLNAPSWSISTEFAAYFLLPAFLAVVFARNIWGPFLTVLASLAGLTGIALSQQRLGLGTTSIDGGLTRCFTEFALGLATFRVVLHPRFRRIVGRDRFAAGVIGVWLLLLILRCDLLTALGIPLLIAALACNRGRVAAWMASPPLYFIGLISFSIYLLHAPIRPIWLHLVQVAHPDPLPTWLALVLALIGSLLAIPLAWAGFVLVERPGRDVIRRSVAGVVGWRADKARPLRSGRSR